MSVGTNCGHKHPLEDFTFQVNLELVKDDDPLPSIPRMAARSLLAYLVTYRDRPHTRPLLVGTFWPDLPDAMAHRRLSQALWQIRNVPSPRQTLLAEANTTVQVDRDFPLWLDVEQFDQLVDGSQQPGETRTTESLLRAAELFP